MPILPYHFLSGEERTQLIDALVEDDSIIHKNASVMASVMHAHLDKLFPHRVKEVIIEWDVQKMDRRVCVVFQNGHKAYTTVGKYRSSEFLALCCMLNDLPEKHDEAPGTE